MKKNRKIYIFLLGIIFLFSNQLVWAYCQINSKFFPSTISTDDPFITNKLILSVFRTESPANNGGNSWTTNPKLLVGKIVTQNLVASINASYLHIQNPGQSVQNGFDNLIVGLRYNVLNCSQTESYFSIALNATLGGTGSEIVNATATTSIAPEIIGMQSLSILPNSLVFLKPVGFFIAISPEIIASNFTVTSINWSATIEYSLPYLAQCVDNVHSPLMNHLVPIIEFPFNTCTQGNCSGQTTGTFNPGFILYDKIGQAGFEAIIPANRKTGSRIGCVIQLHLYLDSLWC